MKPCFLRDMQQGKTYKNNEEYKQYLQKLNRFFLFLSIAGAFIGAMGFGAEFIFEKIKLAIAIDDYMLGIYSGVGAGLFISGIVLIIRNRRIIKDEQKLTRARIEQGDERMRELGNRASQIATYVTLFTLFAISLIGGLFYPILPKILLVVLCIFLVTYGISYQILEKRN